MAVLPSLSQTLLRIKSASHVLSASNMRSQSPSSPSASWYAAATAYHPLPHDPSIALHIRDRHYTVSSSAFPALKKSARALWTSPMITARSPPPLHSNTTSEVRGNLPHSGNACHLILSPGIQVPPLAACRASQICPSGYYHLHRSGVPPLSPKEAATPCIFFVMP
ncbi:hypothetical protein GWK47_025270 [Chionoecetes opilio]|uniref:Uncharacterized protein n=1 Tax=Chionoecetes opilio TaxID=41210 RepID=A0A8J4XKQ1_CHIOP|nr:hypothetical protein GWK47_025270 [Chionoecetes opilio]